MSLTRNHHHHRVSSRDMNLKMWLSSDTICIRKWVYFAVFLSLSLALSADSLHLFCNSSAHEELTLFNPLLCWILIKKFRSCHKALSNVAKLSERAFLIPSHATQHNTISNYKANSNQEKFRGKVKLALVKNQLHLDSLTKLTFKVCVCAVSVSRRRGNWLFWWRTCVRCCHRSPFYLADGFLCTSQAILCDYPVRSRAPKSSLSNEFQRSIDVNDYFVLWRRLMNSISSLAR